MLPSNTNKKNRTKAVYQIDISTGNILKEWASATEAEKKEKYNSRRISQVCRGKAYSSNGYFWKYVDRALAANFAPAGEPKEKHLKDRKAVGCYDILTKEYEVFENLTKVLEKFSDTTTSRDLLRRMVRDTTKFISNKYTGPLFYRDNFAIFYCDTFSLEDFLSRYNALSEQCKICNKKYKSLRSLATHLQSSHQFTSKEYVIKHIYNNNIPVCAEESCLEETRYTSFSFKKYCKKHSINAMKEGGEVGGQAQAWNKGLTKLDDTRILKQSIEMLGQKNHFYGKKHGKNTKEKISSQKRLSKNEILDRLSVRENDYSFEKFNFEIYCSRQFDKITCICKKCSKEVKKTLQSLERGSLCKFCYPFTVSKAEIEIGDFIEKDLLIKPTRNIRSVISPYELDIFVPEKKVAFEYHGLYWHMDRGDKNFDKELHYKKHKMCSENNIKLLQFFSYDWEHKQKIVKSMIANSLGKNKTSIGGRETKVVEISNREAKDFFEKNHLHGYVKAKKCFALECKATQEILSIVSVRTAFHKKYKSSIEIARFATKLNHNVIGGFSKLLKSAIIPYAKDNGYKSIISYADLLTGSGNVYEKSGFINKGHTGLSYWYTDGKVLFNRFKFRATKSLTEKEIAKQNKVYKVYGCGNSLFELVL